MPEAASPSTQDVRRALERILASPDFSVSARVADFLNYVVEETLEGREENIKAFTVAVDVFGRDDTFDPQSDPVVRIEAARLRRALERYYLLAGQDDPIHIDIPKGSYVPTFRVQEKAASPIQPETPKRTVARKWMLLAAVVPALLLAVIAVTTLFRSGPPDADLNASPLGPRVLVLPFSNLGNNATSQLYAAAITDELIGALSRFKEIAVFGVQTARGVANQDIDVLRDRLQVDYVLEGSARTGLDDVRVSVRLIKTSSKAVIWSRTYEYKLTASALFEIPVESAEAVARAIAQPQGIVFSEVAITQQDRPPDDLEAYLCSLSYYVYRDSPTASAHHNLTDCLNSAVVHFPTYATAWALLAQTYIDEVRFGFNPEPGASELALKAARQAVDIDPDNARALQALATVLFFVERPDEAYEYAEQAIAMNPNDSDMLGQIGQLFGLSGQKERGRELLEKALVLNPGKTGFYQGSLAIICYMQKDYSCATNAIEHSDATQVNTYFGIAAVIYAQTGDIGKANAALEKFRQAAPSFIPNLWQELSARNIPLEDQLHIADGLRKLDVAIPQLPEAQ
ncbi:adenylate cyclase [Labrenzia sp. MBR-25]|jgi:TolB-like protein/Tfp pilus assembly protein PilF